MRTANHLVITFAVALIGVIAPISPPAQAQEIEVSGPLAGAPAVIGLRVYREMRFQIQAHSTLTLQDEYTRAVMFGGQLMFHPTDWLGIGVWGGFSAIQIDTGLTDEVKAKGQTNLVNVLSLPTAGKFPSQIGHIKWVAAPEVAFIPLRGKLGVFEKLFVDTDFYLTGGVAFVGVEERADVDAAQFAACRGPGMVPDPLSKQSTCFQGTQGKTASRSAIAPTFGVGLSLYMADFLAMTVEWRAIPFAWNSSGTDEAGNKGFPDDQINSDDQISHFNHMITLGFAFYLPTEPSRSHTD
jgi:hypothetical protein